MVRPKTIRGSRLQIVVNYESTKKRDTLKSVSFFMMYTIAECQKV